MTAVLRLLFKLAPLLVLLYAFRSGTASAVALVADMKNWIGAGLAHLEMSRIGSALESEYGFSGRFPGDFPAFLRETLERPGSDPALDRWGTPLELLVEGGHYEIVSWGPDATLGTADDIVVSGDAAHLVR